MEETRVHALDYLNVFRRRKWWLLAPILASVVVGLILVKVLPKEYRSTATLGVMAPAVSPNFVNPSSPLDNQERLRAISQQLVSPPILARVAKEEGLSDGRLDDPVLAKLRDSVNINVPDPVAPINEARRLDAFIVSYGDPDPGRAQRITGRLVTVFVEENSKLRAARAEDTSAFLDMQLRESQTRLANLEGQLRRAKEAHIGRLPEQTTANLQTLTGLRQQLDANATALRSEQDRLSLVERQLESMVKGSSEVLIMPRAGGDVAQVSAPETRALMLQRELANARQVYTDRHPQVLKLEEELRAARAEVETDRQRPAEDRLARLKLDPAYRELVAAKEMGTLRVNDLRRQETDIRRQIAMYQSRVEASPMVEQQLKSVERDYELEKAQYSELSSKLHEATIAENVERNRRGEQFAVLYPASYPTEPTKPIPWRVMLVTIAIGICLGGGATFAREYLDRSVHDARDIKDEFELPVLGEVTHIQPV